MGGRGRTGQKRGVQSPCRGEGLDDVAHHFPRGPVPAVVRVGELDDKPDGHAAPVRVQASAETNNGGTFSERCKMYVYIRHVCSGQSPHDIKTGAQDMRNQAMAATSEERKALGPAERNGYWYEKAASLYASILRT